MVNYDMVIIWLMMVNYDNYISGWWSTDPSEEYESVGMMTFPIYGKIKMFRTTNQIRFNSIELKIEHDRKVRFE